MTADSLIEALAQDFGPVPRAGLDTRLVGLSAAVAGLAVIVALGARADLSGSLLMPALWLKSLYTVALTAGALHLVSRLGRPGANPRGGLTIVPAVVLVALGGAILSLAGADEADRASQLFGRTWVTCSLSIAAIALAALPPLFLAARSLAPVRPVASGAAMGLAAGAIAATFYGLIYCSENGAVFVAVWYSIGIAAAGLIGALLGRFCLRW